MLDAETKRRIDTARDILVGKVPDPKSQVEQITIALIYKFMDDMDAESEEFGGERKFFAGDFTRYGWAKLTHPGLGGYETLNLYAEAITRMPENPGIPLLFREIFNNAYLPYRDPETLRAFLKVIDEFTYDHSERLGDAFEYLLSVLGAQGDAGQFRTPRHIIDFIIAVVDPKKDDVVLDPACGTAGFLISAYKHILAANTNSDGQSILTPDDRGRLVDNLMGYDISPDMVRLSRVNMYLHGFPSPQIHEYDTLTSEERWNEYADVILANPPFMSPRGGIRPHNRFSVTSGRSEVLFVDYMAEHLTPTGRAGFIVPEGIIFQRQNAYKQLRKMLVEEYLVAVVSLPAGVFNPYSGVKTSVLILDRALAKRTEKIAFFKVENDGFDLGAQRRPIDRNDLPRVQAELTECLHRLGTSQSKGELNLSNGLMVYKDTISADGEYNLSGDRYLVRTPQSTEYPWRKIGTLVKTITPPVKLKKTTFKDMGRFPIIDQSQANIAGWTDDESTLIHSDAPVIVFGDHTCTVKLVDVPFAQGADGIKIIQTADSLDPRFLYYILRVRPLESDGYKRHFTKLKDSEIPLPPMEVQLEIVAEIEGYQKVIDGARAVVENYRPHIVIDPQWPLVTLRDVCEINPETINPALAYPDQTIHYIDISSVENETGRFLGYNEMASTEAPSRARRVVQGGDVLLSTVRPNLRAFTILTEVEDRAIASTGFAVLRARAHSVEPAFVLTSVSSEQAVSQMVAMMGKGAYPSINQSDVAAIKIALPPLNVQQEIVAEIEGERALVQANRELIERFEKKIKTAIARVWREDASALAEA